MKAKALIQRNTPRIVAATAYSVIVGAYNALWDVVFLRYVLNSLGGGAAFSDILLAIGLMLSISLCYYAFGHYYRTIYRPKRSLELERDTFTAIYSKVSEVSYDFLVSSRFYDLYTRVKNAPALLSQEIESIAGVIGDGIIALILAALLITIDPGMLALTLPGILISVAIGRSTAKREYEVERETTEPKRAKEYVKRVIYTQNAAKEMRLFPVANVIKELFTTSHAKIEAVFKKRLKSIAAEKFLSDIIMTSCTLILPLIYILYRVTVQNQMTVGDFSAAILAVLSLSGRITKAAKNLRTIQSREAFLADYERFLNIESSEQRDKKAICDGIDSVVLRNVTFSYPETSHEVLHGVSLTIEPGERIALVGRNGSGKSTIIKLIMGLYHSYNGSILVNGREISQYDQRTYRDRLGVVFQDFRLFAASIKENIFLGRGDAPDATQKLDEAIGRVGLQKRINELPLGVGTEIYSEFEKDGINLSGGETQRVALARAYVKDAELILFDEPASALDPIAEEQLYQDLITSVSGKTVLFISHRLSTVKLADCIYLIDDGRVVESGTHDELIKASGLYAEMFNKQAEKYIAQGERI